MNRLQQTGRALGSDVTLTLVGKQSEDNLKDILKVMWSQIEKFEQRFSRFLPDSELSKFNLQAGKKIKVSPAFTALLAASKKMSQQTDGLYNPFILPSLQMAGYVGSWPTPAKHNPKLNFADRQIQSVDQLVIGEGWAKIPADSALDFGGCGKGYLLDQLAGNLSSLDGYWLSLGGDILCSGHDKNGELWKIGVAGAQQTEHTIASYTNDGVMAVATSGVTKRRGENWHHIIDPRSGQSAQTDTYTATVKAKSGLEADVFAKCLVILGSKMAKQFAHDHKFNAILQTKEGMVEC